MSENSKIIIGLGIFLVALVIINLIITYVFKKDRITFLTALLTILLIASNIISVKMTVFMNLPLSSSIFIYPLTFLCTVSIAELAGGKEAMKSGLYAIILQIIFSGIMYFVVNVLPNQVDTIIIANNLSGIFGSNLITMVKSIGVSILAFTISQLVAIGLYSFIHTYTVRGVAASLSILFGLLLDTLIFTSISLAGNNLLSITIINKFVINVVYTFIMVILFIIFTSNNKKVKKAE